MPRGFCPVKGSRSAIQPLEATAVEVLQVASTPRTKGPSSSACAPWGSSVVHTRVNVDVDPEV